MIALRVLPRGSSEEQKNVCVIVVLRVASWGKQFRATDFAWKTAIAECSRHGRQTARATEIVGNVVYSSGHLLYVRDCTLVAQPFDVKRLELTGSLVCSPLQSSH